MIELTDEMVDVVDRALTEAAGAGTGEARAAARAVLALVERDYRTEPKPPRERPIQCGRDEVHEAHPYGEYDDEQCPGAP